MKEGGERWSAMRGLEGEKGSYSMNWYRVVACKIRKKYKNIHLKEKRRIIL